jgi:hypothetical protein
MSTRKIVVNRAKERFFLSLYKKGLYSYDKTSGAIRNKNGKRLVSKHDGYGRIYTKWNGKTVYILAHRFAMMMCKGKLIPKDMVVNHKDGNGLNNRRSNLEIITSAENAQHAIDTGLNPIKGKRMEHRSKLTDKEVRKIRKIYGTVSKETHKKITLKDLAKEFSITPQAVSYVIKRKTYAYLS